MKSKNFYRTVFYSIATILSIHFYSCDNRRNIDHHQEHEHHDGQHHKQLAEIMYLNQRYMDKLYFAGMNQNWELAEFYHHEMDENMDLLLGERMMEDSINLTEVAKNMYTPASKELDKAIEAKDTTLFIKGYNIMIRSCNNCHIATNHEFIKIIVPEEPSIKNQEY